NYRPCSSIGFVARNFARFSEFAVRIRKVRHKILEKKASNSGILQFIVLKSNQTIFHPRKRRILYRSQRTRLKSALSLPN
ncbi:MAG TPA: hypothetical protein VJ044_13670, partial [Candidatus Hodarchaeales archaeon]|nr:hypothetical protein [Candidatus Hodarchaeales archaeon]